ncbi:hypothetical protein C8J55DRAFT_494469 [Lentinula edodes]|uniref:Uncharacterized protein n=1 Tax=Lentinula lateritia TaxID=40482 RepID=A0A9W8ZP91_9AGAR|nr:hypothetical protein C8J55DRAFT_494469 [Lentinula edodes]
MIHDHANSAYISRFARWKAKAAAKTQAEQKRKVAERRKEAEKRRSVGLGLERVEGVESEAGEKARFFWQAVIGLGPNLDQGGHEAQEVVIQVLQKKLIQRSIKLNTNTTERRFAQITAQHIRPLLVSKLHWRGVGERGWEAQDNNCDDADAEFDVDNGGRYLNHPTQDISRFVMTIIMVEMSLSLVEYLLGFSGSTTTMGHSFRSSDGNRDYSEYWSCAT